MYSFLSMTFSYFGKHFFVSPEHFAFWRYGLLINRSRCILVISGRPTWNLVAGLKIWINIHFGNTKKRHLFVFRKSAIFEFFFCKNSKNASYFLPLRKNTFWKHCLDFLQKKSCTIFQKLN